MAIQYVGSSGGVINESASVQYVGPEGSVTNETSGATGSATAVGATLTGTSSIAGGSASGASAGTALGATLASTSSITGGTATAANVGTLTIVDVKNNTGSLRIAEVFQAYVYVRATGVLVVALSNNTVNGSGQLILTDALITPGTTYRVVLVDSSDDAGVGKVVAA